MRSRSRPLALAICLALITLSAAGCTTRLRNKQLAKVAKDWALVIRASQVIPVYPLTEDLLPGDILLVQTPIEEQVRLYKKDGFLPLDQLLVRLPGPDANEADAYKGFYGRRYPISRRTLPPFLGTLGDGTGPIPDDPDDDRVFVDADSGAGDGSENDAAATTNKHNWEWAPRAAFPTYRFKVKTGTGLNMAIPVQGVPFALGLMNSGKASGNVTITDAHTIGLDIVRLEREAREWARSNRSLLIDYAPGPNGSRQYLRVVSRVYVASRVNVTVNNDQSTAVNAKAGEDRPVTMMADAQGDAAANYTSALRAINDLATSQLPGVNAKVAVASSRSVSMSESFPRPLVVGYVGFDLPILEGGLLGPAISTLAQLNSITIPDLSSSAETYRFAAITHMYATLTTMAADGEDGQRDDAKRIATELDDLTTLLPAKYPFTPYETDMRDACQEGDVRVGDSVDRENFLDVVSYITLANEAVVALESCVGSDAIEQPRLTELLTALEVARAARDVAAKRLESQPVLKKAFDFVLIGE